MRYCLKRRKNAPAMGQESLKLRKFSISLCASARFTLYKYGCRVISPFTAQMLLRHWHMHNLKWRKCLMINLTCSTCMRIYLKRTDFAHQNPQTIFFLLLVFAHKSLQCMVFSAICCILDDVSLLPSMIRKLPRILCI